MYLHKLNLKKTKFMNKMIMNRLTMLAVTLMASMACFAQGKSGEATGWTAAQFGPNFQELSYSVTTNSVYHEAIVTGFASYVVDDPAIMDDPETYAPGDVNLQIEKNTIIINHYMKGGSNLDVYIPSVAANAFANVASDLAEKIKTIKIDFKENSESEDYTQDIPVVIGEKAFAGLTSVTKVQSYSPTPPTCSEDAFASSVKTLIVPAGSSVMGLYAKSNAKAWRKIATIKNTDGLQFGDVDKDGRVRSGDLTTLQSVIKGKKPANDACDVDGDGRVRSGDLTTLQKEIKGNYR